MFENGHQMEYVICMKENTHTIKFITKSQSQILLRTERKLRKQLVILSQLARGSFIITKIKAAARTGLQGRVSFRFILLLFCKLFWFHRCSKWCNPSQQQNNSYRLDSVSYVRFSCISCTLPFCKIEGTLQP